MSSANVSEQHSLISIADHNSALVDNKHLALIDEDDVPADNPKLAILYFVLYTIFSTYNLIAGKFFRTWYPGMSTF